jgi:hypothetical protein
MPCGTAQVASLAGQDQGLCLPPSSRTAPRAGIPPAVFRGGRLARGVRKRPGLVTAGPLRDYLMPAAVQAAANWGVQICATV